MPISSVKSRRLDHSLHAPPILADASHQSSRGMTERRLREDDRLNAMPTPIHCEAMRSAPCASCAGNPRFRPSSSRPGAGSVHARRRHQGHRRAPASRFRFTRTCSATMRVRPGQCPATTRGRYRTSSGFRIAMPAGLPPLCRDRASPLRAECLNQIGYFRQNLGHPSPGLNEWFPSAAMPQARSLSRRL
jgi:hypothetical protein